MLNIGPMIAIIMFQQLKIKMTIKQLIKKSQWLMEISECNKNNLLVNKNNKHVFNLPPYQKTPKQKTIMINMTIVLI
jgi:hypothetical protein